MVIRQAIESSAADAEAILKAADISTYTGSLVLCLDRSKVPYRVPVYVINDPVKFWPNEEERLALVEKPEEVVKKEQVVKAMVISIDKDAKKIALSMKSAINSEANAFGKQADVKSATLADKLAGFKVDETES